MKKQILTSLRLIAFGLVLSIGLSYIAYATPWTPNSNPPANNTATPIDVLNNQTKLGPLEVGSMVSRGDAELNGATFLGMIRANKTAYSTVLFGEGNNNVSVISSNKVTAEQNLISTTLAANPQTARKVCANQRGELLLCTPACSDTEDNDADGLPDNQDPGCHTDGNVWNTSSYDPQDDNEYDAPLPSCVLQLEFSGNFRWGRVVVEGQNATSHPQLTVTVRLYGTEAEGPGGPYEYDDGRDEIFIIPANSTDSWYNGRSCGSSGAGIGCEIEGPFGFDIGEVIGSVPDTIPGGVVCF